MRALIEPIALETAALPGPRPRTLAELFLEQPSADVESSRGSLPALEQHETNSGQTSATAYPFSSQDREPEPEPQLHDSVDSTSGAVGDFSELTPPADALHESDEDLFEIDLDLPSASTATDDDEQDLFDLDLQRAGVPSTTEPAPETNSASTSALTGSSFSPPREAEIKSPQSKDGKRMLASGLQFGLSIGLGASYSKTRPPKRHGSLPPRAPLGKLKKEEIENGATPHAIAASLQNTVAPPPVTRQKRPGLLKRGATALGWTPGKVEDGHYGWNNGLQFTPAKGAGKIGGTERTAAALAKKNQHLSDLGELVSSRLEELNARLQAAEEVCGQVLRACKDAEIARRNVQDAQMALQERQENLKGTEQSLREEMDQLAAHHAKLSVDLANVPEAPAIPMGEAAVAAFHHQMAEALLMQAKATRDSADYQVARSGAALRATREESVTLPSFSLERIKAAALIKELEAAHRHNLDSLAEAELDILNSETRREEHERELTEVDKKIREYQEVLTQRAPIEEELAACHDRHNATQQHLKAVQHALVTNEAEIESARQAHADAQGAEREVKFQFDSARAAVQQLRRQIADFGEQLQPVQDQAVVIQVRAAEAQAAEAAVQVKVDRDREESMRTLIEAPPGFGPAPELSAVLTDLRDRLEATLDKAPAASRLPVAETLEIVTRSLALETGGNAAEAGRLLKALMRLPFTALVPPPGQPIVDWPPANLVRRLAGMSCGPQTLRRITSDKGAPPEPAQMSALQVYYKADSAVMEHLRLPESQQDPATLVWLTTAAQAAKRLIHAKEGSRPLSTIELTAFNGVRNGFTSLTKGSDYDVTNQWLKKVAVWLDRAKEIRTLKNSPLNGRGAMQTVGFDVGLPTVERTLSTTLQAACEALLQKTTATIIEARPEPSDALLRAATLLNRVAKRGHKHQRWDTLTIGRGDWRRIKRDTQSWAHRERVPAKVPRTLRNAAKALPQAMPDGAEPATHRRGRSSPVDSAALDAALLGLSTQRKTSLLEVLQTLQPLLSGPARAESPSVELSVPALDFTFMGPLSPIEEEDEESGEWVLDEAARDRTARAHTSDGQAEHEEQVDAELADIRRRLNALRMMEPMLEASPVPDEIGTLIAKAAQLQKQSDDFARRDRLDSNALEAWLAPVVGDTSGSVFTSQGTTYGLNTTGLSWAVNKLGPQLVGLSITADAEVTRRRQHELAVKRDSKGLNLLIGETTQWAGKWGGMFGVGIPFLLKADRDRSALSLRAGYKRGASSLQAQGIAVREPKSGDMVKNFEDMLHTLLNWNQIHGEDATPAFNDPLTALFARHPTVSIGKTSAETKTFSADTALGIGMSFSGPSIINKKPGSAGVGPEWRIGASNATTFETIKGAQCIDSHTRSRALMNSVRLAVSAAFSPSVVSDPHLDARPRTLSMFLEKTLRLSFAQEGFKWVSMPDGTLVADRAVEFTSFKKFKQRIDSHREEWIAHVIRSTKWPEGLSPAAIRLCVEDDLNHFMQRAEERVHNGGTVTLNETMDVKPEVCARLTALANAGALAAEQGFEDDADKHLQKLKELLGDDTSYMPYKAKVIVRSEIALSRGTDWGIVAKSETKARGMNESETWPR